MASLANVCTSRARGHQFWHRILDAERNGTSSKWAISTLRVSIDSFMRSFVEYSNQGSELVVEGTISHKLIVFGFGFFILVVSSTYTANLATFLTMNVFDSYITDVESQILGSNLKICVQDVIVPLLKPRFKDIENNPMKIIPKVDFDYIREGIGYLQSGDCDVMFADETDFKFIHDDKYKEFTCNSGLVSIKTKVMEVEWSVPVRSTYIKSFNWAVSDRSMREVNFVDILNSYKSPLDCEIYLKSGAIDNSKIRPQEMLFPFTILILCFLIGILSKILERRNRIRSDKDKKLDDHMESLDMMKYRYRLELIALNTERLLKNMAKSMDQKDNEAKFD